MRGRLDHDERAASLQANEIISTHRKEVNDLVDRLHTVEATGRTLTRFALRNEVRKSVVCYGGS